MRSKTYMSKINLQRGKLTVENRKRREKKTDMLRSIGKQSGNPWSQLNAIERNAEYRPSRDHSGRYKGKMWEKSPQEFSQFNLTSGFRRH